MANKGADNADKARTAAGSSTWIGSWMFVLRCVFLAASGRFLWLGLDAALGVSPGTHEARAYLTSLASSGHVLGQLHSQLLAVVMALEIVIASYDRPTLYRWSLTDVLQHHISTLVMLLSAEFASRSAIAHLTSADFIVVWQAISTVSAGWLCTSTGVEICRTRQKLAMDCGDPGRALNWDLAALTLSLVDMCVTGPLCSPVLGWAAWYSRNASIFVMFLLVTVFMLVLYPAWVRSIARKLRRRIGELRGARAATRGAAAND